MIVAHDLTGSSALLGGDWDAPDRGPSGCAHGDVLNILNRWESAELNQEEALEPLSVTERAFRRWTRRDV
jgi:hypothetical protein